jgi:hypothetical protein
VSERVDLSEAGDSPPARRRALVIAAWTAFVIFSALVLRIQIGLPLRYAWASEGVNLYTLALLSIPVWRISARLAGRQWGASRLIAAHVGMGVLVLIVWKAVLVLFLYANLGRAVWRLVFAETWLFQLLGAATTYGSMLGIMLALQAHDRERARERREAALRLGAREAELGALRAHLQPHFLFNALNSVLALIERDPAEAKELPMRRRVNVSRGPLASS